MKDRIEIIETIADYEEECSRTQRKPSRNGIAKKLSIAPQTIYNICSGYYSKNKPYTVTPNIRRCIDNNDFELIKGIFD